MVEKESKNKVYVGATLYPWQKAVADEICIPHNENKVVVVKSHRQCGKSFACINILLFYAINKRRSSNAMISPTLNQSRAMFKELVNAITASGIIKSKNEMLLTIELINGSSIFFKSAEQRDALRGFHVDFLILDEAAYLTDDILALVLPWRNVSSANMLVVSTPFRKDGFFYRYYCMGLERQKNTVSIDWNDYDTSALLSDEQKQTYKQLLPKNQYLTEIEGEFLEDDGMVFTDIVSAVGNPGESDKVFVGIDWGSGKGEDYTSITMFNGNGEMCLLHYWNDLGTLEQISKLADLLIKYSDKIVKIQAESNSIGSPLIELLTNELIKRGYTGIASTIEPFTTTNAEKVRLVSQLQVGFEQHTIRILNNKKLINELAAYSATYNAKTGNVSYNAPLGLHDDTVISTMLAFDAYKGGAYAQYSFGFVHNKKIAYNRR